MHNFVFPSESLACCVPEFKIKSVFLRIYYCLEDVNFSLFIRLLAKLPYTAIYRVGHIIIGKKMRERPESQFHQGLFLILVTFRYALRYSYLNTGHFCQHHRKEVKRIVISMNHRILVFFQNPVSCFQMWNNVLIGWHHINPATQSFYLFVRNTIRIGVTDKIELHPRPINVPVKLHYQVSLTTRVQNTCYYRYSYHILYFFFSSS